ncbi:hypothetical protein [Croceimicrobium sp.]|uniref:hypothetical protein n=1 Tax=Croceimicrobium sp. TaxID=2828340 RepID=UPI003BA96BB0
MLRGLLLGCCLLTAMGGKAQSLDTLISHFNRDIALYESVYPFQEPIPLDSAGLNAKERAEFFENFAGSDKIYPTDLQWAYLSRLNTSVQALFEHPDLYSRDLKTELNAEIQFTDDGRFLQISFEENTGGTYRSQLVYYHYRGPQGQFSLSNREEEPQNFVLKSDGYTSIIALGTKNDSTYYFFTAYVRGCSYCFEESFGLILVTEEGIKEAYNYTIDSRSWGEKIDVDFSEEGDSLIKVRYLPDDLNAGCQCGSLEEASTHPDQEGYPAQDRLCKLLFRYHQFQIYLIEEGCIYQDPLGQPLEEY